MLTFLKRLFTRAPKATNDANIWVVYYAQYDEIKMITLLPGQRPIYLEPGIVVLGRLLE